MSPQSLQNSNAARAQSSSQPSSQQSANGISPLKFMKVQTRSQQPALSQPGAGWGMKQLPVPGTPQVSIEEQRKSVARTQAESHSIAQQNGSCAQTSLQQLKLLQPGSGCVALQLASAPPTPQRQVGRSQVSVAKSAQRRSHRTSQQ